MEPRILLTGATGYIGARLLHMLEAEGYRVRCIARKPEFLHDRIAPGTEVMEGDVLEIDSMQPAMKDIHVAYYLVHSMGAAQGFEEMDRKAAACFGEAARASGVRRIIYPGGLSSASDDCWRVEAIEPDHRLLLAAEMKMPGRAWLDVDAGSIVFSDKADCIML
jgi:uncharacterized protein YbjT (DUF2867 family)